MRLLEKKQFDDLSSIAKSHDDGVVEGLEKGLKEGEKKGIEKGLKEGKQQKEREIALNMKKQGLDNDFIAEFLDISIEKLNTLLGV